MKHPDPSLSGRCPQCNGYCENVQRTPANFPAVVCDPAMRASYVHCPGCERPTSVLLADARARGTGEVWHGSCESKARA